jgi:hypothetical protein
MLATAFWISGKPMKKAKSQQRRGNAPRATVGTYA